MAWRYLYSRISYFPAIMTDAFVSSEVDRTKSRWVAKVFKEFGRPKTTLRGLFYFALSRAEADYPICGGFVGEIRITRPYHENDGPKLVKWADKAQRLDFLPANALLKEEPGEHTILPEACSSQTHRVEFWLNRSAFNPLLAPVCARHGAVLVSTESISNNLVEKLLDRAACRTTILCLSDLSLKSFLFCDSLNAALAQFRHRHAPEIRVHRVGLSPEQVLRWKIPMVSQEKGSKEASRQFKSHLQAYGLDHKKMAELDALEAFYPKGIAGFCEDLLTEYGKDVSDTKEGA
mgnify:CR=1 FL=1